MLCLSTATPTQVFEPHGATKPPKTPSCLKPSATPDAEGISFRQWIDRLSGNRELRYEGSWLSPFRRVWVPSLYPRYCPYLRPSGPAEILSMLALGACVDSAEPLLNNAEPILGQKLRVHMIPVGKEQTDPLGDIVAYAWSGTR